MSLDFEFVHTHMNTNIETHEMVKNYVMFSHPDLDMDFAIKMTKMIN